MTAAFIIRFHYPEGHKDFSHRLKLFKELTLPSLRKQTDKDFDICVRCYPHHDEVFKKLGCKPFHVRNEYEAYYEKGFNFHDFAKWEDVLDLPQYDIQMGLDSDDFIEPGYVARIKEECRKVSTSLHIHFQPEWYWYLQKEKARHHRRYSSRSCSAFFALYYPGKSEYHHCYEISHLRLYQLAEQSVLVPSGYCWVALHPWAASKMKRSRARRRK